MSYVTDILAEEERQRQKKKKIKKQRLQRIIGVAVFDIVSAIIDFKEEYKIW